MCLPLIVSNSGNTVKKSNASPKVCMVSNTNTMAKYLQGDQYIFLIKTNRADRKKLNNCGTQKAKNTDLKNKNDFYNLIIKYREST